MKLFLCALMIAYASDGTVENRYQAVGAYATEAECQAMLRKVEGLFQGAGGTPRRAFIGGCYDHPKVVPGAWGSFKGVGKTPIRGPGLL